MGVYGQVQSCLHEDKGLLHKPQSRAMVRSAVQGNWALVPSLLSHLAWPVCTLTLLPPRRRNPAHSCASSLHLG